MMRPGFILGIVVVAIVLVVALPRLLVGGIPIGDANQRVNDSGVEADGVADIEVHGYPYLTGLNDPLRFSVMRLRVTEMLEAPAGPVLTALPPATVDTDCKGQYRLSASGAQLDGGVSARSEERTFTLEDSNVTFKFGHLWLYQGNSYSLRIELYVWDCLDMVEQTLVRTDTAHFTFDGKSENFDGGDLN